MEELPFSDWCILAGIPDNNLNIKKAQRLIKLKLVLPKGQLSSPLISYLDILATRYFEEDNSDSM